MLVVDSSVPPHDKQRKSGVLQFRWVRVVLVFISGFVCAILVATTLKGFGLAGLPRSPLDTWGADTPCWGLLHIVPPGSDVLVSFRKDGHGRLDSIALGKGVGCIFQYQQQGLTGRGEAWYGSGIGLDKGMTWIDIDFDGVFDIRSDHDRNGLEVLLSGEWVRASRINGLEAETSKGWARFVPELRQWRFTEPDRGAKRPSETK
jgi:hypothetical protein